MKKQNTAALSILSGLLLFSAWPVSPLTLLIFVAWVPLLAIADTGIRRNKFIACVFITTLLWNTGATWWIWNSTDVGTIAAIIFNSLLMCLPWLGYIVLKKKYGKRIGYIALIACWACFEYLHLNWQLSWPWLTLGNVFATHPGWVQWYEYTGVAGGTLWILLTNILLYETLGSFRNGALNRNMAVAAILVWVLPFVFSVLLKPGEPVTGGKQNVVIVQPNIDPYQKFSVDNAAQQIDQLIQLSEQQIDSNTQLVIWPETAMSVGEWQEHVADNPFYHPVFDWVNRHPGLTLLSGIETYKNYGPQKATVSARQADNGSYYDAFNAAVNIRSGEPLQFYNKSKLVPGVESLPNFLRFMAPVFEQFGGTTGGYGRSETSAVFSPFAHSGTDYVTAPIICYESVYGAYIGSYVQKGANLLTIMTNDGWWGNTPGHKQHLQYARLRAVESRRWVARSANTGISAVIDPLGNIKATLPWDTAAALKWQVPVGNGQTFYTRFGDYLYMIASFLTALLILWHTFGIVRKNLTRPVEPVVK